MVVILVILTIILTEALIFFWIKKIEISRWILTEKDLKFNFSRKKFKNFKDQSYNEVLGWDFKKNFKNFDYYQNKKISYKISNLGYRHSNNNKKKNIIATFGDSYVFSRQVNDDQTWQEILSNNLNIFVSNYGVGNYGLDQAFLKYLKTKNSKSTKIIIFGFVPETICRIQSIWKNYLEFGNIHGFKPYIELKNKKLFFKKNFLKDQIKFENLDLIINKIKRKDRFYKTKFKKRIFKFSYLISFLRNFEINSKLIFLTFNYVFKKKTNIKDIENKMFPSIMSKNIDDSHSLYKEKYSRELLIKLIEEIHRKIISKKKQVYFIVFPQLYDLKKKSRTNYQNLFKDLKKKNNKLKILDLTSKFLNKKYKNFYVNDKYGGHLNTRGNKFVAKEIKRMIDYENNT
jgi:hypothetical protein